MKSCLHELIDEIEEILGKASFIKKVTPKNRVIIVYSIVRPLEFIINNIDNESCNIPKGGEKYCYYVKNKILELMDLFESTFKDDSLKEYDITSEEVENFILQVQKKSHMKEEDIIRKSQLICYNHPPTYSELIENIKKIRFEIKTYMNNVDYLVIINKLHREIQYFELIEVIIYILFTNKKRKGFNHKMKKTKQEISNYTYTIPFHGYEFKKCKICWRSFPLETKQHKKSKVLCKLHDLICTDKGYNKRFNIFLPHVIKQVINIQLAFKKFVRLSLPRFTRQVVFKSTTRRLSRHRQFMNKSSNYKFARQFKLQSNYRRFSTNQLQLTIPRFIRKLQLYPRIPKLNNVQKRLLLFEQLKLENGFFPYLHKFLKQRGCQFTCPKEVIEIVELPIDCSEDLSKYAEELNKYMEKLNDDVYEKNFWKSYIEYFAIYFEEYFNTLISAEAWLNVEGTCTHGGNRTTKKQNIYMHKLDVLNMTYDKIIHSK